MTSTRPGLLVVALVTGLLTLCLPGRGAGHGLAVADEPARGEAHPALRLPTIDGTRSIDLHALRGRKVVLIQFASW